MKVFISRDIPAQGIDLLRAEGFEVTVWQVDRPLTQPELIENAKQHDALVCMFSDKIDKVFAFRARANETHIADQHIP